MRKRYSIIDYESLIDFFNAQSMDELRKTYRGWVGEALEKQSYRKREPQWTESIAVGNEVFIRETKEKLGIKAIERERMRIMKRISIWLACVFLFGGVVDAAAKKDLEIQGKRMVSQKPPFTSMAPSGLRLIHSFSHDNPTESSLTRVYFYIKDREKKAEEMLIVQIADKTNPQALPMTAPSLKPYSEKRMYSKGKVKRGDLEIEHLTQLMAWNPDATSLQPIIKKGFTIPPHWALQGQFQFIYLGEHGVFVRYSKEVNSFGINVSKEGKDWEKDVFSGNEKKVYEVFKKSFMEMVNSIQIRN